MNEDECLKELKYLQSKGNFNTIRTCFTIDGIDYKLWVNMPFRLNQGDSLFISEFFNENYIEKIGRSVYEEISDLPFDVYLMIIQNDENGIYFNIYLEECE